MFFIKNNAWTNLPLTAPKTVGAMLFLPVRTLPTFWAEHIFITEITWCRISIKDSSREDNMHFDNEPNSGLVKVLGTLNSDWNTKDMGGGFTHGDQVYSVNPTDFIIFDASVPHRADNILTNKKRFAIDYTVKGV